MLPEERGEICLFCHFSSSPFISHLNTVSEKGDSVGGGDSRNSLLPWAVPGFPSKGLEERREMGCVLGKGGR